MCNEGETERKIETFIYNFLNFEKASETVGVAFYNTIAKGLGL